KCVENNTVSCSPWTGHCDCLPGWTSDTCSQDIDECSTQSMPCREYSSCRNTIGDYDCDCNKTLGYQNADHKTCKLIDCIYTLTNSSGTLSSPGYP
ncbi:unnamed protein product, partial [Lymnaea stagnalis]